MLPLHFSHLYKFLISWTILILLNFFNFYFIWNFNLLCFKYSTFINLQSLFMYQFMFFAIYIIFMFMFMIMLFLWYKMTMLMFMCNNVFMCCPIMRINNYVRMTMTVIFNHCIIYNNYAADYHKNKTNEIYQSKFFSIYYKC